MIFKKKKKKRKDAVKDTWSFAPSVGSFHSIRSGKLKNKRKIKERPLVDKLPQLFGI